MRVQTELPEGKQASPARLAEAEECTTSGPSNREKSPSESIQGTSPVTPINIRPLPKMRDRPKRRRGNKGSTVIATSSPYKKALAEQLSRARPVVKKVKSGRGGKGKSEICKAALQTKQKLLKRALATTTKKKVTEKKKEQVNVKRKLIESDGSSEREAADSTTCFYCDETFQYGDSRRREAWVLCLGPCSRWAHEQCAGVDSFEDFTCEICM